MNEVSLSELKEICANAGFSRKGSAFFRIVGDGVLQVVKCQHERRLHTDLIFVGLHSMYAALQSRFFTATCCRANYSIVNCVEQNDRPQISVPDLHVQLQMLQDQVIPWLNGIDAQKKLVAAICKLDSRWNDNTKIGPYLACGELNHTKKVIKEIIGPNAFAQVRKASKAEETLDELLARVYKQQEQYCGIIEIIDRGHDAIRAYLQSNYTQNMQYAKFCIHKTGDG